MSPRHVWPLAPLLCLICLIAACGDDAEIGNESAVEVDCLPNEAAYNDTVRPMIEQACGQCHGDEPDFGAPFSLLDYDGLVAGTEGTRRVDYVVEQLSVADMPPAGYPRPEHNVQDTIVGWASCGLAHPDYQAGLTATAPVFLAPEDPPEGLQTIDVLAPDFAVDANMLNRYQCFSFENLVDSDKFIRRFEIQIDDSRVLHHVVLMRDSSGGSSAETFRCTGLPEGEYVYGWAPGAGPLEFPDGGLRLTPSDRLILQIHYNNGAAIEGVTDSSGVRLYVDEPGGTEYGMFSPGPNFFSVEPHSLGTANSGCPIEEEMTVLAGMPHMHETGSEFSQEIIRADGTIETLIELAGWSFELQLYYDLATQLHPGDMISTTCVFDNQTDRTITFGPNTSDEMCYNFMYVTPPPHQEFCDVPLSIDVEYQPGRCLPTTAPQTAPSVTGELVVGSLPEFRGGAFTDGTYQLSGIEGRITPNLSLVGSFIDLEKSLFAGAGQLIIDEEQIILDVTAEISVFITAQDASMGQTVQYSLNGDHDTESVAASRAIMLDCSDFGSDEIELQVDIADGQIQVLVYYSVAGFDIPVVLTFN